MFERMTKEYDRGVPSSKWQKSNYKHWVKKNNHKYDVVNASMGRTAVTGQQESSTNTMFVSCIMGLLLNLLAVRVVYYCLLSIDLFLLPKYKLVPSIVITTCCPYNQIRKERKCSLCN